MILQDLLPNPQVHSFCIGRMEASEDGERELLTQSKGRQVIRLNQQHTDICLVVDNQHELSTVDFSQPADAVLSDRSDMVLTLRTADCLPILLYHPSGIIGAIHAGRLGTQQHILEQALLLLKAKWGIDRDVTLWFGPAICERCYQVDRVNLTCYNLREQNLQQAEAIFPSKSIKIINFEHCTAHENSEWYSYRTENGTEERNVSGIGLSHSPF